MKMINFFVGLLCLAASACTSVPPPVGIADEQTALFHDRLFSPSDDVIDAAQIFALSPEMKKYLDVDIHAQLRREGTTMGLIEALNKKGQIKLDYDSERTRTAAQAFADRTGNCLSLVVMTAALAKELGLRVSYQHVITDEVWSRSGDLYFSAGHVNLVLGKRKQTYQNSLYGDTGSVTIDFLPPEDASLLRSEALSENTVIAMFMNNRAVEALEQGKLDDAYWWVKAAIQSNPGFMAAYNTLGVIYHHHENNVQADQVLQYILHKEPNNTNALGNEVVVLNAMGKLHEAELLEQKLESLAPYPPFYFFNLAQKAMKRSDFNAARQLFAKELARAPYNHEAHFGMALASYYLHDFERAGEELSLADENSVTQKQHALYAAKLYSLKSYIGR